MKIYTKQGDQGQTSLVDGSKVTKSDIRIKTYGTVDELNSHLGLLISLLEKEAEFKIENQELLKVQAWLFQLGSQLACSDPKLAEKLPTISVDEIVEMEKQIDLWDKDLPALKNFILPGGHIASAQAHVCRTISRRAERCAVALDQQEKISLPAISFLNRISDYFYVLARVINYRLNIATPEWKA